MSPAIIDNTQTERSNPPEKVAFTFDVNPIKILHKDAKKNANQSAYHVRYKPGEF